MATTATDFLICQITATFNRSFLVKTKSVT